MSDLQLHIEKPVSLWRDNPMFVHLLGISPLVAVTDSATKALGLGVGMLLVGFLSALTLKALSKTIQSSAELFWSLWICLTLGAYTSLFVLLLQLMFFPLFRELGIYSYLIACNLALIVKLNACIDAPRWSDVITGSAKLGASLLLTLLGFAIVRELLFSGSLFQGWEMLIPDTVGGTEMLLENRESFFRFARLQPAGFILLGLCIATARLTRSLGLSPLLHRSSKPVERARATGRLKEIKQG